MDDGKMLINGRLIGKSQADAEYWKEKYANLRHAVAYATGRLDLVPQNAEGNLCVEVRKELLDALNI